MKAKINVMGVFEEVEIIGKPFQIKGIRFHVSRKQIMTYWGSYIITEWSTGCIFAKSKTKKRIRPEINIIFKKIGMERVNREINKLIMEYGIANKKMPDNTEKPKAGIPP